MPLQLYESTLRLSLFSIFDLINIQFSISLHLPWHSLGHYDRGETHHVICVVINNRLRGMGAEEWHRSLVVWTVSWLAIGHGSWG